MSIQLLPLKTLLSFEICGHVVWLAVTNVLDEYPASIFREDEYDIKMLRL
jgi:hypothetical protein